MKDKDLNKWAVPHDKLPEKLYFVHHAGSQCRFVDRYKGEEDECPNDLNLSGGITAASPDGIFDCIENLTNVTEIYRKIQRHLDWSNRRPSCFVSTFKSDMDALRWTLQVNGPAKIYTIDTSLATSLPMPPVHIFRPSDFNVNWTKNEYLFFHQIPHHAILEKPSIFQNDESSKGMLRVTFHSLDLATFWPLPKGNKRKREEDVVSTRKTRSRTNAGKAVVPHYKGCW